MFVVGSLGSYFSRRVCTVLRPVRSFSGAIDIVVVKQPDGTFKSSPWCVRFGKIQLGFKATEKVVSVIFNGVNADFDMYLDRRRETFFYREVEVVEGELEPYVLFGDVTDVDTDLKRAQKSKSYNFDSDRSDLDSELKSSKGSVLPQNNSRLGRLFRVTQKSMNFRSGSSKIHPFSFNRLNCMQGQCLDSEPASKEVANMDVAQPKVSKRKMRAKAPTSEQLASLKLKEGMNDVVFSFLTAMLGKQQVAARIFLWKWNTQIVISDVDGTITKSDLLGQFMHMMGMDWSHTGVAHLFSAIKENGYQLLFVSARSISQAYLTRQFLLNLKQDGRELPDGPVLISPDGLFPSLYREVISRTPHEFKISCLEVIRLLFPPGHNPFYAGFGNRDTDEISYLRVGIPIEKIFIINPKGQIAGNRRVDTKSYASLHSLVHGMFPPAPLTEQDSGG